MGRDSGAGSVRVIRRIGAHLSAAGGYNNAVDAAVSIGANTVQIFSGSPRVWARKPIQEDQLVAFKKYADQYDIRPIFVHSLYLMNLASENTELVQKSKKALIHDLKFGSYFDCAGVVVHLGSHQGRGWETCREQVRVLIQEIIDEAGVTTPFLMENSAGQTGKLCSDLADIRWLLDQVKRPSLGWCYDTCHGWAAGYAVHPQSDSQRDLLAALKEYDLWSSLRCIHANDSRDSAASGRDRHDNILKGNIPKEEFVDFFNHPQIRTIPLITEAPGLDGNGPDKPNIDALKSLV